MVEDRLYFSPRSQGPPSSDKWAARLPPHPGVCLCAAGLTSSTALQVRQDGIICIS